MDDKSKGTTDFQQGHDSWAEEDLDNEEQSKGENIFAIVCLCLLIASMTYLAFDLYTIKQDMKIFIEELQKDYEQRKQ